MAKKEDKYTLGYAIGGSIQENKDKIAQLEKQNKKLKTKLKEQNKVMDEIFDYTALNEYCPYKAFYGEEQEKCDKVKKLCDCDHCQDNYRECWLKYFKNKTKEVK